jgi:para-nitrobenzyl esterase
VLALADGASIFSVMRNPDRWTRRPRAAAIVASASLVLGSCATVKPAGTPSTSAPRVTADAGMLEGRVDTSGVLVFDGVPYAAPPVGELRWRPPRPVASWQGVRPANRLGRNCMQHQPYGDITADVIGKSEDCLYLNVWTQSLEGRRPVMVWIHGGGFFAGFGGEERHNGATLAKKGAVVVTVNYRLGAFGFMAHPALAAESPEHSSGNYGLLDQIAALQWVQRNIARFGGDPSRVTIFGESAGAMSTGSLVGSPLAKGLFQRAILESGTGTVGLQSRAVAEGLGVKIASALGVTGTDAAAAARLRAVPAESLLAVAVSQQPNRGSPILFPAIDGWVLPRPVDSSLALGSANGVPVIVGSNADESQDFFGAPSRAFARLITSRGAPAWVYLYSRVGDDSLSRRMGAYHSSEITFVFGRPKPLQAVAGHTSYDATLADAMSDFWVAFATAGDPNGPPAAGKWPRWPAYDPKADTYMELGREIAPKRDLRRALWDSLDVVARARGQVRP